MSRFPRSQSQHLFYQFDFYSVRMARQRLLSDEIASISQENIVVSDTEEMVSQLVARHRVDVPQLIEGAISVTVDEAQVDVTGNIMYGAFGPGPNYAPGIKVTYYVPFSGEKDMFRCKPNTWSTNLAAAELGDQELRITFVRPGEDVAATKTEFDRQLALIKQHLGWLAENCRDFNLSLPGLARHEIAARKSRLEQMTQSVESMGVPIRRAAAAVGTSRPLRSHRQDMPVGHLKPVDRYDVALSFAGENRAYVAEVATLLQQAGVSVFYDKFESSKLWGRNLIDHLADIYGNRSRFVVMFISREYVDKVWTNHERRHAQERALLAQQEYILPARFDDTPVPGLTSTVAFQDLRRTTPLELSALIVAKLRA